MTPSELQALHEKATQGPVYVIFDEATDTKDHAHSGLAMIDTGRSMDWPIARLCEWPTAHLVAYLYNSVPDLLDMMRKLERAEAILTRIAGRYTDHQASGALGFPDGAMAWAMNSDAQEYFAGKGQE